MFWHNVSFFCLAFSYFSLKNIENSQEHALFCYLWKTTHVLRVIREIITKKFWHMNLFLCIFYCIFHFNLNAFFWVIVFGLFWSFLTVLSEWIIYSSILNATPLSFILKHVIFVLVFLSRFQIFRHSASRRKNFPRPPSEYSRQHKSLGCGSL